ncbi:MAG: molybdate ABC transporter substrate-binding protein [Oscillospiraceae bacterium]|nr:molybdate ABC transporter substrate-binding protein [Oscillospiraceae bacterium]
MKRWMALALALVMALALAGCGARQTETEAQTEQVTLTVFAAASLQETVTEIVEMYKAVAPEVTVVCSFDSSGTLKTQIQEGAECDLFISAAPKQMNALDGARDAEHGNPEGLDLLLQGSRVDLLENRVALSVAQGRGTGIASFDDLAAALREGAVLLAMGNSDVPVGQYTQKIFDYYGLNEEELAAAGCLTYGSNVKEVTSQVAEAAVDCGIIYATDACSAGLPITDTATAEMCGQVIYPAAVLNTSAHPEAAQAFLDYLCSEEAGAVFAAVGFTPLG